MKILFLTYGPPIVASSRTRVFQYLPFFENEGIKYKVITNSTELSYRLSQISCPVGFATKWIKGVQFLLAYLLLKFDLIFSYSQIMRVTLLAKFYDIIFIQKVLIPTFVLKLIGKVFKKKIVFDFDDAIYAEIKASKKRRFDQQLSLSDLIVVENIFTEEYARRFTNSNVLKITGPIDCGRYYCPNSIEKDDIVIGWIGSVGTTKYLFMIRNALEKLIVKNKTVAVELIGASEVLFESSQVRLKQWSLNSEVGNLQNFDIGIMPLPDEEWTRGKGGYKLLQYMAVGIPCVASPVGINKELIKDGVNGFLATTEEQWYEKLSLLIENPQLRKQMGIRGRDFVVKNFSFEVAAPKLISALKGLL